MKKIVLTINDTDYERFKLEAMIEEKSIPEVIKDRLFFKPFDNEIESSISEWLQNQVNKILGE